MKLKEEYQYSTGSQLRFEVLKSGVPVFVEYSNFYYLPHDQEDIKTHADNLCDWHEGDTCVVTTITVFEWSEIR